MAPVPPNTVLEHGRIIGQGTHRELLANGGYYAKLRGFNEAQNGTEPARPDGQSGIGAIGLMPSKRSELDMIH